MEHVQLRPVNSTDIQTSAGDYSRAGEYSRDEGGVYSEDDRGGGIYESIGDATQVLMPYCDTMVMVGIIRTIIPGVGSRVKEGVEEGVGIGKVKVIGKVSGIDDGLGLGVDSMSDETSSQQPTATVFLAMHHDFAIQLVVQTIVRPSFSDSSRIAHSPSMSLLSDQSHNHGSSGGSGGSPPRYPISHSPLRSPAFSHLGAAGGGGSGGSGGGGSGGGQQWMDVKPTTHGPLGELDLMLGQSFVTTTCHSFLFFMPHFSFMQRSPIYATLIHLFTFVLIYFPSPTLILTTS